MDRLNFFNPFSHKQVGEEDPLTRAFLTLLRYEPLAQAIFLDLVREALSGSDCDVPSLTQMSKEVVASTQVTNLPATLQRLVSVLITDQTLTNLPTIEIHDREARYDGVLDYGDWTFIIENKPSIKDVWTAQLNPARSSIPDPVNIEIIPHCACLTWGEILQRLGNLDQNQLLSSPGRIMLGDFLDMVDEEYSSLAPFRTFALCKNDRDRLLKRCRLVITNIAKQVHLAVGDRRSRFPYLHYPGGIVEEIDLAPETITQDTRDWALKINIWPGDTAKQARAFYDKVDPGALLSLRDAGWDIKPNLHFAYMSTHLIWSFAEISIERYFDIWKNKIHNYGQLKLEHDTIPTLVQSLSKLGLIGLAEINELETRFAQTARNHINVIPGLHMAYLITRQSALNWENNGTLESNIIVIMNQGISPWGQSLIQTESDKN